MSSTDSSARSRWMDSLRPPRQARCWFARDHPSGNRACGLALARRWRLQFWKLQHQGFQHSYFDDRRSVIVGQQADCGMLTLAIAQMSRREAIADLAKTALTVGWAIHGQDGPPGELK